VLIVGVCNIEGIFLFDYFRVFWVSEGGGFVKPLREIGIARFENSFETANSYTFGAFFTKMIN
jgi:hypothetical protein